MIGLTSLRVLQEFLDGTAGFWLGDFLQGNYLKLLLEPFMGFLAFEPLIRHQAKEESLLRVCNESFAIGRNGFLGRVGFSTLFLWCELVYIGRLSLPVVPRNIRLSRSEERRVGKECRS